MSTLHDRASQRNNFQIIPLSRPRIERGVDCHGFYVLRGDHAWLLGDRRQSITSNGGGARHHHELAHPPTTRGGVDGVKAVRRLLKYAGRYLGLRAIDIQERATNGGIRATEHFGAVLDLIARANNSRR